MNTAVAVSNAVMSYYDDCAGDPTCPATDEQIAIWIGIVVIGTVAFFVIGFLILGMDKIGQKIRKARWNGIVHSSSAACGAKTIDRSSGPDTTMDAARITCTACKTALKSGGWDGLVHGESVRSSFETLCGLKKQSYQSGIWIPIHIDHFVKVYDETRGSWTSNYSRNRPRVTCPECRKVFEKD